MSEPKKQKSQNALTHPKKELSTVLNWTPEQIKLIKDTVAKGTTDDEFKLFLYTATKYSLDPLIKQIWCIKYGNDPAAIFTGRDGFLSKAHESGKFNGMKTTVRIEPVPFSKKIKKKGYNGKADEWIDFKKESQFVATTLVFRKDMEHPIEVEVWEEEYSSGQSNWAVKPRTMKKTLKNLYNNSTGAKLTHMTILEETSTAIKPDPHKEALLKVQPVAVQQAIQHILSNDWNNVSASTCYLYPNRLNFLLMELGEWTRERADMIDLLYEATEASI